MPISLVTGGAGFIGSHVVDQLIDLNHTVIVLDDLSGGFKENINSKASLIKGSILDEKLIDTLFLQHQFDYVYHLAAYAAEGLSHFIRRYNYQNNMIGSVNLINASVKYNIKCFVFTSSIAVYGTNTLPMTEEISARPSDPYAIAKYAIELDLKSANEMFGLNYIIFRPHNVYGQRQNLSDPYRNVIGIFMNQALQNKPLTVFGQGNQTRAFSHIHDVAPHIARSVHVKKAYQEVINIGNNHTYTVNEIAEQVLKVLDSDSQIEYLPERKEVLHAHADHHKLHTIFHLTDDTVTSLQNGLQDTATWARSVKIKPPQLFHKFEIEKNLPPSWKLK